MDTFIIRLGYTLILAAIALSFTVKADDPFSRGRVKPFYCPKGTIPADTDRDGYADTCYREDTGRQRREQCRQRAKTYCSSYSGAAYWRCINVEYQRCG